MTKSIFEQLGCVNEYLAICELQKFIGPENVSKLLFWLAWERAQEKEWWVDFLVKTYGPEYWHSVLNLGYLVHPTRFFDALYDFLKGGDARDSQK